MSAEHKLSYLRNMNSASQYAQQNFSLREFLIILFKDKKRILAGFIIPLVVAIILSVLVTPRYEAVSTVMVRMGREYLYRPELGESNAPPVAADREQTLHSEVAIIKSRDQMEKVIREIGLERLYPAIAAKGENGQSKNFASALVEFERRLDVLLLKDSNIVQVSFQHPDAGIAAEVVNRLIDSYLLKRREIFSSNRVPFAENQMKLAKEKLDDIEKKIEVFKRNNNIVSYSQQLDLLLAQRGNLEVKLKQAQESLAGMEKRLAATKTSLGKLSNNIALYSETTIDNANAALVEMQNREREARAKFNDDSPVLIDLRASIRSAERQVRELELAKATSVRLGRNSARDDVEIALDRLTAEQKATEATRNLLADQLSAINAGITRFSAQQGELESMTRERQLNETTYQAAVRKLQEAVSADELDRNAKASVSVVQSALPPIQKKSVKTIILLVGLVISFCCALLIAFLSEFLRTTFISPEKMERVLRLPVLASIPLRSASQGHLKE